MYFFFFFGNVGLNIFTVADALNTWALVQWGHSFSSGPALFCLGITQIIWLLTPPTNNPENGFYRRVWSAMAISSLDDASSTNHLVDTALSHRWFHQNERCVVSQHSLLCDSIYGRALRSLRVRNGPPVGRSVPHNRLEQPRNHSGSSTPYNSHKVTWL